MSTLTLSVVGYDWTLLSDDYIKSGSGSQSRSWRNFFLPFGVVDFLAVVSRSVTLSAEQLVSSVVAGRENNIFEYRIRPN